MKKKIFKFFSQTKVQILLLIIVTFLSYFNILSNGLSYDDRDFLVDWPAIQDSETGLSSFLSLPDLLAGELPANHRGVYRPIRSVYYLVSYKLWGMNPFAFHLQAIFVHTLIVILIYYILLILTKKQGASFFGASIFAVHPIHTEAITYTAASFDSLGILFFFAAFYFYIKADYVPKFRKKISLFLSLMLAFLAFFTYEMTLILPVLIIFYDFCFKKLDKNNLLKKINFYLPYFSLLLFYLIIRVVVLKIGDRGDYFGPLYIVASNQAKVAVPEIIGQYLMMLIYPFRLSVSHNTPLFLFLEFIKFMKRIDPTDTLLTYISEIISLYPLVLVLALTFAAVKLLKKYPLIVFCIGWFLLSLLPILNILPQGATMAERFLYIPSFGLCALAGIALYELRKKKVPGLALSFFVTIILIFSVTTHIRNKDWSDVYSIFKSVLRLDKSDYLANGALGLEYFKAGNTEESIRYYKVALNTNPDAFKTHYELGLVYEKANQPQEAVSEYLKTLKIEQDFYFAHISIGNVYKKQEKFDEAITEYKKALDFAPDNFEAHFNLGATYLHQNLLDQAMAEFQSGLKLNPNDASSYNNIAYIYSLQGRKEEAISTYTKSLEIDPNNFYTLLNLGSAFEEKGDYPQALELYKKAANIKPDDKATGEKIQNLSNTH